MKSRTLFLTLTTFAAALWLTGCCSPAPKTSAAPKKIIFIAGKPSHPPLAHEHRAGCLLLSKCLADVPGVVSEVYSNGWPDDEKVFEGAAAVVVYSDGGGGHPFLQGDRLQKIGALMDKGLGLACLHYAVEPTLPKGQKEFLEWIGGAFEINWSVNPHWDGDFKTLPPHPITRGVAPFKTNDEWYFHMRFRDNMQGVTPILTSIAPDGTMSRPDGDHSGNPAVRKAVANKEPQHVSWAYVRPDGGRGFGFTGGHNHLGWANEDQRRLVLNAILWVAKVEVPKNGVQSKVTQEELMLNLDPKPAAKPRPVSAK
ncbi:MAG TPA: ThuA domain-containing protein [Roseimicrobium sp.]|nr:ThuA domain-containing protein [Roseimicrobium sp.]